MGRPRPEGRSPDLLRHLIPLAGLLILTGACGRDTNAPGTDHARQPEIADVATAGSGVPAVSSITLVHHGLQLDDEIVARRTSHSYTFRKGNGSYLQVIGAGQVNYLDRNRDYRPIDTSITIYDGAAIAGGPIDSLSPVVVPAFANTTNSLRSYFPADPTAGVLVTVDSDEDGTGDVGVQWLPTRRVLERPGGRIAIEPIANDVLGQADGSVMRYAGTYPDTVEEYVVRTGRLKHNLILSAPPAAASLDSGSLSFEGTLLLSAGLRAHVGGVAQSGDFTTTSPIEFRDADGKPVFQFGQPQAYEQGSIRTSIPVEYRLSTDPAGVTTLALATKLAWLGDPARVYPVVIDPDVVITGDYSADSNSVTKWDADDVDCVGKIPPSTYMRSGTRFPLTSIPAGASINTLTLQVECNDAQSEGTRINRLITDPEVASAGTIHAEAASGTEYVANSPILAATGTRTQALGATAVSDVQTEVDSSGTWFAFGMKQPTEGANQYGEWRSVAWGTPAERPQLTVNYTLLPKVTQIVPFAGINTSTTAVTITGVNFTGATSVTINGSALSPMSVDSDTQITGTVLSGIAAGDWPVIVTTPEGDSTGRTVDFTVYAQGPPTVVSIIPDSGDNSGATAVTITGTNFTGATSVTINGSALSPMSVDSDTQITGTVLSGIAPGSWPVIVTTPLGTSSGNTVNFDVYSDQSDLYTKVDGTTIPDNTPAGIDSTITVPVGDDVVIKDVRVYLDITHPHVGDLIITLTSPGSTTVQIHGNQMGWMWDDIDKVWYDTVAGPSGNLDDFDGENSAGDWTLNVSDNNNVPDANDGTLNEWRLAINQLPDLTISSSDISFDNPTPTDGELVNISATVHNPSQYVHREAILTAPKNETLGGSGWPVSSAVGEAQSFVPASDVTVTGVEITIWSNVATTTASFTAQIETDSGGEPSGTAVSSQTTLSPPTMGGWLAFDFETPAQLIASTTYWIVVWSTNTENNYWDFSEGNLYPAGICAQNTGGSWSVCSGADADDDMTFRLRGRETFARFYDGDPDTNDDDIPMNNGEGATTIGADQFVANIPAFGQATAQVSWDTTGKAGAHDIFAWADPGNPAAGAIDEYSDSNNLASKSITVAAAGIPGLWTGAIDSDWGKGGNWDDGNLPDSTIDVVIPVTANDPEIDGTEPFANREVATLEIQTGAKLTMLDFDAGGDKELRVYGDVNIQSGAELIINSSGLGPRWKYLTLYGTNPTISINGTITGNGDGDGGCPDVYVRRPLTVTGSGKINAYVTINNSLANSGALTLGSDFDLNGDGEASNYSQLHIGHEAVGTGDATLFLGGFTLDVGGHVDIFGTNVTPAVPCIDMANAADIIEADGSFTNSGGGLFDEGSGLIRFTGGADQSIASETYWNVELAKTGGTVTLNGAIDVGGSLTLNGGTLDVTAANSWPITVYGNWTYNTGTFLAQSGTVTLAGGAAQSIGGTGTPSFHALYIDNSHATEVVSVDSDTTVNDALTVNDGTLQVPASQTLTIDNSGATTSTVESAATLDVEANGTLELSDDTTLQVSGELEAAGTDAGNRAVVTSTGAADRYTLIVDTNGTINASYHRFEYFDGSGIQIQGNATVISLDNGLFDYPADSGTELNVSGVAALPAQISGCIFDNTGAATSPTNVTADASTDPVDMVSFSGDLAADAVAAENTDDDPNDRVTWLKPDGYACSGDTECESTFCVDGVCCNNACGGGDTADCQACSVAQGASGDGTCEVLPNTWTCRADAGECDVAEACDGAATTCPADGFESEFTACGSSSSDECDNADSCDAGGNCLPRNVPVGTPCTDATPDDCDDARCDGTGLCDQAQDVELATYVCNADADGQCNADDTCDGVSGGACPSIFEPIGTPCGVAAPEDPECDAADTCDASGTCLENNVAAGASCTDTTPGDCDDARCDGTGLCDQAQAVELATYVCNADADGQCNVDDTCDGVSGGACPSTFEPIGTPCGVAAPEDPECDAADTCDASGTCLENNVAAGAPCTDATPGDCDDARCDGTGLCDQAQTVELATYVCNADADGQCNVDDTCDGVSGGACPSTFEPIGTPCGVAAPEDPECDAADTCDASGTCLENNVAAGAPCTDATPGDCDDARCDGTGLCDQAQTVELATYVCNADADGQCNVDDTCDGVSGGACPSTFEPSGTPCGVAAPEDPECDAADTCDASGTCLENNVAAGAPCTDATPGDCDDARCDGTGLCDQAQDVELATYVCNADADGQCNVDDTCDGVSGGACPSTFEPNGTPCGVAAPEDPECDAADTCDASGTCLENNVAAGAPCTDATPGDCDDARCDGTGLCDQAQDVELATYVCNADADGQCNADDTCDGVSGGACPSTFEPSGTPCGVAAPEDPECDAADACDASGTCLENNVAAGASCTDTTPGDCDDARCDGTGLCDQAQDVELATYVCNADADGQCNVDDTCNGVSGGACPSAFEPIGTPCGVAAPEDPECDAADTCDASGTCLENNVAAGAPCTDATPGDCDDARCDGTGLCDQARDVELNGYVCRADAGECDVAETCDGVSGGACPADGFEPEFTACGSSSSDECDAADSCDAGGNCLPRNVPVGTPCTDATPDDCDDAQCDGSGACNQAQDVELNGYVCRADAGSCDVAEACDGVSGGACPADGFAPVDTVCDTCGRCDGGGSCAYDETQDDDCGFCQECSGLGACANQMLGDDVKDECTQDACNTGTCNGSGACGFEPNTTDCGVCSICDGNGACVYDETQDLDCNICQECSALGICVNQAPGHDVKDECTHDACNTGTCDGSGACGFEPNTTDCGVCSICDGSGACVYDETQDLDCNICQECSALGLCANQLAGSDVKDECATDACHSGACDGGGNCEQELPGAECLAQSCTPGDATTPSRVDWADTCDAGGICQDNGSQSCGGYRVCNGDDCPTTCAGDGDCIDAYHCDGANVCVPDAGIGQPCGGPGDCSVGTCVDGYCCATACDGVCERCDASGSEGTCTALPDGQDPDNECDPDGCHPGTCNGFNACTQEDTGHACDLCGRCDAAGSCEYDELQDTDCPTCQECSALGSCVVQPAGSDAKDECAQDVCNTGTCDGAGACGFEPNTTDCEICGTCDGSGACVYDETQDDDCPTCQECSALATCINQASGSDTKDECAPDGCHPGHCDGNGACFQETEGHDCEICGQCDATGACVYDETQNADCPACEKCSGLGACTAQASNEDLKDDCTTDGCHPGYCNGASACAIEAEGTDCGTCAACDATGNCAVYDEDQDADCPACQECAALDTCSPVAETLDPKDDCDPDGCHPGHCDGAGACALEPADTDCGVCAACDDTGACVFDGLQDDDCGECQVCADVDSCAPQAQGEDIKDECDPDPCRPGHCDGAGACALEPVDTDCGTCAACDATGVCAYDGDQHDDCGPCLRCDGIDACVPQDDGEDIKDDCGAQTCASAGYYHGWIGDDCLFDGSSYGELCDGNGACRSAAADCDGAIAGAVATTRGACHTREGCAGILPPIPGFVPDGADDFDDCEPDAESTCGMDGLCDGSGSCRLWPAGTECAAAFCQDDTEHAPDTCDGLGVCQDGGSLPCALQACVPGSGATASYVRLGGACDGDACGEGSVQVCTGYVTCDGSVCPASCAGDDDCVDFYHCDDTSQCVPDEHLGVECTDHGECASGFCVDGYCCNSLCDGTCERCDVPGSIGACAPEPAGQDEQEACEEDACRYGYCNGAGACAMRSAWTDCGVCARCNGQGACNQYDETQDDDCPACQECSTLGACGPVAEGEDPKWDCEAGPCRSGTCDGAGACALIAEGTPCDVCATCGPLGECDRFIEFGTDPEDDCGECQVCAGSSAACVPVAAGEDPLDECEEDPAASCLRNGSCDGAGACALWSAGTECAARVCAADVLSFADICDGTGVCLDGGTLDCGAAGCVDDHCGDQLDNGEPCTGDDRCISGHCDDDVCCEVDCSGTCRACDVPGRLGQCTFHVADTDPESECNAISCTAGATRYFHGWDRGTCYYRADVTDTEADCNGSGACKPPAAECAEQGRGDSTGVYRSDCTVTTGCYGSTPGALDPVPTGTDPNGDCSASAPQTCGYDGDCDGRGSCNYWEQSTECEAARCTYGVAYEAGLCNGSGTCAAGASQFCFPYPCVGTVCGDSCTARQDCASSAHCADGACVPDECQPGVSESCGTDVGRCEKGTRTCEDGVWSACIGAVEPVQEICDNELDDDCDGFTDCLDTEDCGAEPHCLAEADADAEADAEADAGAEICEVAEGGEPPQAIARARIEDGQWSEDALEGPAVLAVTLDASLSEAGAAPIWRFRWDPGDGSTLLAGKTVVHRYWVPGSYRATVTATDCADGSNTSDPIAVTTTDPDGNRAPVVTIESIEVDGQNPLKVSAAMSVTDADGDDTVLATSWSFGEGQAAAGLQADHVYSTSGTYVLEASAVDERGLIGRDHSFVTVGGVDPAETPKVTVTADPVAGPAPLVVQLTAAIDGGWDHQLSWDFGDGSTAGPKTTTGILHTFDSPGVYHVRARATSGDRVGVGGVTVTATATDGGLPPRIISTPSLTAAAGEAYHYDDDDTVEVSGSLVDLEFSLGKEISGTLINQPVGMEIHPTTGSITWVPSRSQVREPQRVTVVVRNSHGSDFQDWTVTVTGSPPPADDCGCGGGGGGNAAGGLLLLLAAALGWRRRKR